MISDFPRQIPSSTADCMQTRSLTMSSVVPPIVMSSKYITHHIVQRRVEFSVGGTNKTAGDPMDHPVGHLQQTAETGPPRKGWMEKSTQIDIFQELKPE